MLFVTMSNQVLLTAGDLRIGKTQSHRLGKSSLTIHRRDQDDPGVCRLLLEMPGQIEMELLPSKGLSVGALRVGKRDVFWNAPYDRILDPDGLNLDEGLLINGVEEPGFRFIENFVGGIELLGLQNWGMPAVDPVSGRLLSIHGDASNVPVDEVRCDARSDTITITAVFTLRDRTSGVIEGIPWYRQGDPIWSVERRIRVTAQPVASMMMIDTITNLWNAPMSPDWGYHIQFQAEPGARLVIPSRTVSLRGGGDIPPAHDVWHKSPSGGRRVERGIIHRGCTTQHHTELGEVIRADVEYPDGNRIAFWMPNAPYVQSWFSSGGQGSGEFALPDAPEKDIMPKNWDGFGPEIGASALDHDGDIDPDVDVPTLAPGASITLGMEFVPSWACPPR